MFVSRISWRFFIIYITFLNCNQVNVISCLNLILASFYKLGKNVFRVSVVCEINVEN